jgi:hypothetical protein
MTMKRNKRYQSDDFFEENGLNENQLQEYHEPDVSMQEIVHGIGNVIESSINLFDSGYRLYELIRKRNQ